MQDVSLSCLGSLASILLVRWVSSPEFGFTTHVLIWIGTSLVFTLIGLWLSGSTRIVARFESFRASSCLIYTVLIKEAGMLIPVLTGLIGVHALSLIVLLMFADASFSALLLFYPRALVSQMREEDNEVRTLPGRLNALVFGAGESAAEMADSAARSGQYNILGLLSRDPEMSGRVIGEYIIYYAATEQDMEALQWRLGGIDCILFPKDTTGGPAAPSGGGGAAEESSVAHVDGMSAAGQVVKRGFDLIISGLLLIVFSPLIAICALAVRLEDGRPVIYRQERIGREGRPFYILKFRSMRVDAESAGPALYSGDNDPRLTRVGKFLRQHHLDELPQLWNVFRGDMSFIGYRPERQFYIDRIMAVNPRYQYLYQIRPGVTSYATLYNGYTDTLEKMLTRLDLDLYYLRNHSIWFDLRVLILTFLNIAGGKKF